MKQFFSKNINQLFFLLSGDTAWNGKCSGDTMWASPRGSQIRHARHLLTKIHRGFTPHRTSSEITLHLLYTSPHFTRRAS